MTSNYDAVHGPSTPRARRVIASWWDVQFRNDPFVYRVEAYDKKDAFSKAAQKRNTAGIVAAKEEIHQQPCQHLNKELVNMSDVICTDCKEIVNHELE